MLPLGRVEQNPGDDIRGSLGKSGKIIIKNVQLSLSGHHRVSLSRRWDVSDVVAAAKVSLLRKKTTNVLPQKPTQTPSPFLSGEESGEGTAVPRSYQTRLPRHCSEDSELPPPHASPSRARTRAQAGLGSRPRGPHRLLSSEQQLGLQLGPTPLGERPSACHPHRPPRWLTRLLLPPRSCTVQGTPREL